MSKIAHKIIHSHQWTEYKDNKVFLFTETSFACGKTDTTNVEKHSEYAHTKAAYMPLSDSKPCKRCAEYIERMKR